MDLKETFGARGMICYNGIIEERVEKMIYTDMTKKAMKLCFDAHKEQVDKSGLP